MQIAEVQSTKEENLIPQNQSEAQLLQPAMEDLKFGRTIDGDTALEAVKVKHGLNTNIQSR